MCVSDAQGQMEPLTQRHGAREGEKTRTTFCLSFPHKLRPDVGKDQAGSGPAGRQKGLAKLPITSQKFRGPPGGLHPSWRPSKLGAHVSRSS